MRLVFRRVRLRSPVATHFTFSQVEGAKVVGKVKAVETPISKEDQQFEMVLSWFERNATFIQKINVTSAEYSVKGEIIYMGCNDQTCLPPTPEDFAFSGSKKTTSQQTTEKQEILTEEQTTTADSKKSTVVPTEANKNTI